MVGAIAGSGSVVDGVGGVESGGDVAMETSLYIPVRRQCRSGLVSRLHASSEHHPPYGRAVAPLWCTCLLRMRDMHMPAGGGRLVTVLAEAHAPCHARCSVARFICLACALQAAVPPLLRAARASNLRAHADVWTRVAKKQWRSPGRTRLSPFQPSAPSFRPSHAPTASAAISPSWQHGALARCGDLACGGQRAPGGTLKEPRHADKAT